MSKRTNRTRAVRRLATAGLLSALTAVSVAPALVSAEERSPSPPSSNRASAAAWATRYQNWSQVPGNRAGAVFRPYGDRFETWEFRDGYRSTLYWNYKGIADCWKSIRLYDGHNVEFDLNLRESRHVYFIVQTDKHASPTYVSEYRISGR